MEPRALVGLPARKIHPAVWPALVRADGVPRPPEPPFQDSRAGRREARGEGGLAGPAGKQSGRRRPPAAAQASPHAAAHRAQLTPRGKGIGGDFPRFAQIPGPKMSSLPPPAGRGAEKQLSSYTEPPAWGWGPKAWKLLEAPSWPHSLKVGQPFPPMDDMQTEGPASPCKVAPALFAPRGPISRPTLRQPRAFRGSSVPPNGSPASALLYAPEERPRWAERDFSTPVGQGGRRRLLKAVPMAGNLNCALRSPNPLGNSLQISTLFCQVTTTGVHQAQSL